MTDYISRADAIAYIDRVINSGLGRNKSLDYIHKYISALPSADRPQGEWVQLDNENNVYDIKGVKSWGTNYQCPHCGQIHTLIENFGQWNYCQNCGARMKGGNE